MGKPAFLFRRLPTRQRVFIRMDEQVECDEDRALSARPRTDHARSASRSHRRPSSSFRVRDLIGGLGRLSLTIDPSALTISAARSPGLRRARKHPHKFWSNAARPLRRCTFPRGDAYAPALFGDRTLGGCATIDSLGQPSLPRSCRVVIGWAHRTQPRVVGSATDKPVPRDRHRHWHQTSHL